MMWTAMTATYTAALACAGTKWRVIDAQHAGPFWVVNLGHARGEKRRVPFLDTDSRDVVTRCVQQTVAPMRRKTRKG